MSNESFRVWPCGNKPTRACLKTFDAWGHRGNGFNERLPQKQRGSRVVTMMVSHPKRDFFVVATLELLLRLPKRTSTKRLARVLKKKGCLLTLPQVEDLMTSRWGVPLRGYGTFFLLEGKRQDEVLLAGISYESGMYFADLEELSRTLVRRGGSRFLLGNFPRRK